VISLLLNTFIETHGTPRRIVLREDAEEEANVNVTIKIL
jgi:hypothetical protein